MKCHQHLERNCGAGGEKQTVFLNNCSVFWWWEKHFGEISAETECRTGAKYQAGGECQACKTVLDEWHDDTC